MKTYEAVDKRFLTMNPHETGSIAWYVQAHQASRNGEVSISADISMTDCSRKIGLEFYVDRPWLYKERLGKIDNLMDSLSEFKEELIKARRANVEAIIKYRKENKGERFKSKDASEVCSGGHEDSSSE